MDIAMVIKFRSIGRSQTWLPLLSALAFENGLAYR